MTADVFCKKIPAADMNGLRLRLITHPEQVILLEP